MNNKLARFKSILRSPVTFEPLQLDEQTQGWVSPSGMSHACVNGISILVKNPGQMHLNPPPPEKISCNIKEYVPIGDLPPDGKVLHLGSGNVPSGDPRVISLDVLPCENVDLVGEAENLPFVDGCFDLVESGAVFEHLYDPLKAISEVKRVLKDGGIFRIDNSFMQGYHGFPSHYFNMTTQANETYLVDDFLLMDSRIPESGTPLMTLNSILSRFLELVPLQLREQVQKMTVSEFHTLVRSDLTSSNPLLIEFSEFSLRALAATHVMTAKKPLNYDNQKRALQANPYEYGKWVQLKREYYTARMEVILRHHEALLYRRFCLESHKNLPAVKELKPIEVILNNNLLTNPFSLSDISNCNNSLKDQESQVREIRNAYITVHLAN